MLASERLPAWAAWIVARVREHPDLTLTLVVATPAAVDQRRPLFALYERIDRRLFPVEPDALAPTDVAPLLAGIPREPAGDAVAVHGLDVILHLDGERPRGPILDAARHGVWSYGFGEPPLFRHGGTALERLHDDGTETIYRSVGAVDAVSLHRNRVPAYWKSARFAVRALEALADERGLRAEAISPAGTPAAPSDTETIRHVATVAGRMARRKLRTAAFQHQWFLGLRRRDGDRLPQDDPRAWRPLLPPPDRSYADPFVVRHGDATYVFLEVLPHATGTGELAVGRVEADGRLGDITPILPVRHHTSYPYVFEDGGHLFLIPETGDARRVDLLAATRFPTAWERVATLIEGVNAVDATVHAHDGRYFMWVTIAAPGARLVDETFVYFSDRLDGGWTPHPRNPVVSDARHARPAGRPFEHRGRLIRPAQDCSVRYGGRIVFNVVEVLTPEDYRERPGGTFEPDWAPIPNLAAHTYTFDGEWEATDGLRTFPRALRLGRR
jgi:hypothetical protein